MIGELHATYVFETTGVAKAMWERVTKRCRQISINRWALGTAATGCVVTVLTEEQFRPSFERACNLLGQVGEEIETPPFVLEAFVLKRAREAVETPGGRRVVRSAEGIYLTPDGRHAGPVRRPQG